jgi:hypothetical protein
MEGRPQGTEAAFSRQSAKADFVHFQRRIHSLRLDGGPSAPDCRHPHHHRPHPPTIRTVAVRLLADPHPPSSDTPAAHPWAGVCA